MKPVQSEILIEAPPRRVFEVLLDVDRYPQWNPFTPWISVSSQEFEVGREFDLHCQMTPRQLLENEREVVLALDRHRLQLCMGTSRTRGRPGIRSFRWQRCFPADGGGTRFVNSERFEGPLAPLVYLLYGRKLARAFEVYGRALKRRAEGEGEGEGED
jgi:uncharacterized protein YndB with AHSA1/START domain